MYHQLAFWVSFSVVSETFLTQLRLKETLITIYIIAEMRIAGLSFDNAAFKGGRERDLGIESVEDKRWQQATEKCHG